MRVLVSIKRVIDYNVRVRAKADGSGVETAGVKMGINPFDENALEAALRLREAGLASEVVVVSFGESAVQDALRGALAMGADRAIWGEAGGPLDQLAVARLLKVVVEREAPGLVLLGKQAIDEDAGQTAAMLAALLDWPQALAASSLALDDGRLTVVREIDGGTETLALSLPAVVSADLRLNAPRFVKLPDLMKARRLPIEALDCAAACPDLAPRVIATQVVEPPPRAAGKVVGSVAELVEKLKVEARVVS